MSDEKISLDALHQREQNSRDPLEKLENILALVEYFRNEADFVQCETYAKRGLSLSREEKNTRYEVVFLHRYAVNRFYRGDFDMALKLLQEAVILAEKSNYTLELSMIYNLIGILYMETDDSLQALQYHQRALKIRQELKDMKSIVASMNNIAALYAKMEDFKKSLDVLKEAMVNAKKLNNDEYIISINFNIGNRYFDMQDYDKAMECYEYGLQHCSDTRNRKNYANYNHSIAQILLKQEKYEAALKKAMIPLPIAEQGDDKALMKKTYDTLMQIYVGLEDYQKAYEYQKKFYDVSLYLTVHEKMKQLENIQENKDRIEKEREQEIFKQNIELMEMKHMLEERNDDLVKIATSKDYIMGIVAHDLKNSIGSILSAIDLMKDMHMCNDEPASRFIDITALAAGQALALVQDILQVNQIDTEKFKLDVSRHVLQTVWKEHSELFAVKATQKDIDLITNFPEEDCIIAADENRLVQILDNVITNAIKFSKRGGIVLITGKQEKKKCIITVADSGIGISPDKLEEIFSPFSAARRKGTEGEMTTGLGLSIVKKLMDLHNASVEVTSQEGKGTTITLTFPTKALSGH